MGSEFLDYQSALKSSLEAQFPDMFISVFAKIDADNFSKPSIVLQLPSMQPSPVSTIQNFILTIKNTAFVIYTLSIDPYGYTCQQLATNLANFINYNNFNSNAMKAKVTKINPIEIKGLNNVVIMQIDFMQDLQITSKN